MLMLPKEQWSLVVGGPFGTCHATYEARWQHAESRQSERGITDGVILLNEYIRSNRLQCRRRHGRRKRNTQTLQGNNRIAIEQLRYPEPAEDAFNSALEHIHTTMQHLKISMRHGKYLQQTMLKKIQANRGPSRNRIFPTFHSLFTIQLP
jgi:hypothetical protein